MNKQERINAIYKTNVKMALLQSLVTFPMSFFTVGLIRSDSFNGWYVTSVFVCLLLLGGSFLKANRFETGLTEREGAKRIIARRNAFTFSLFVLSIFSIALTLKLGWTYVWILGVAASVIYVGYRLIRKQDERLTDIDPEHPMLKEIRLDHVKD